MGPLQRKILEDEKPELVTGLVEFPSDTWAWTLTAFMPASRTREASPRRSSFVALAG